MVRFAKALLDENTILFKEKETYNELFTATMYYDGTSKIRNCHGFWALEGYGTELIGHNGVTSGCSSNLVLDLKNKCGMVIQTNQRNEQVYNFGMLYRIFGGNGRSLENYSGLIMSARSVFTGPLKLYSLFNIASVENGNSPILLVKRTNEGGIDRIACAYGDYFVIDTGDIATDIAVLALYGISVLYAIINILIYIIRRIVALKKHKKIEKPMAGWCKLSCVLPLVPAIVGVLVIPTFLELQQWPYLVYKILFFIIFMDILAMMVLVLYGIFKMIKCEMKKLRKAYVISMNICMIMAVVSAIYWEWGMFWKV